ncbi:MAG: hypothetical protein ACFB0B_03250 [Thermonemataceae bacterium]
MKAITFNALRKVFIMIDRKCFLISISIWYLCMHPLLAQEKRISDYYRVFKEEYLVDYPIKIAESDTNYFIVYEKDEANGFMIYQPNRADFLSITLTLWNNRPNGKDLVGYAARGCGPACGQEIYFFEFSGNTYQDVTNQILPTAIQQAIV